MRLTKINDSPWVWKVARGVLGFFSASFCWYEAVQFRTQSYGSFGVGWLYSLPFFLPLLVLMFLGLPWRKVALGATLLWLGIVAVVETSALVEEAAFRRAHRSLPPDAPTVIQRRWWPCSYHHLSYNPATQTWGAGD